MKLPAIILCAFAALAAPVHSEEAPDKLFFDRLMDGEKLAYPDMNSLSWEAHFTALLSRRFACHPSNASGNGSKGWTLADDLLAFFRGPPAKLKIAAGKYVVGSACRHRSCDEKAIFVADMKRQQIAFGMLHYFEWTGEDREWKPSGLLTLFVLPGTDENTIAVSAVIATNWAASYMPLPPFQVYRLPEVRGCGVS